MKEIIQQIKLIEQEQRKRAKMPLANYNKRKVHHKQMIFHQTVNKDNRWVFGGNRSGKTECGAVETVWLSRGVHPYRTNKDNISCWVVSLSQQVQRDVAQAKILYYLEKSWIVDIVMSSGKKTSPAYGIIDYIVISNVFGGTSTIAFKSCEAGREKFQGTSLDFVWFDEEPPEDIYNECRMRVLDRCGHIFGTMTPLKGATWVYDEIYLNRHNSEQVWYITMEWADNPYLDGKQVDMLTATLSDGQLDSRRYGRFSANSGLVYFEFDPNIHIIQPIELPIAFQDNISIDPGLNNPLSCHWYCVDGDGVVYVVAEHYEAGRDIAYHSKAIDNICIRLNWKRDGKGRINALIDSAANQRTLSGQKSVAELFFERNIAVNTRVNKDIFSGVNIVKRYLSVANGKASIYIFSNCVNLIREIKNYRWGDNDNPRKSDDHAMDELRYYLASRPQPHIDKQLTKSWVQKDKERLIRQQGARR